MVWGTNEVANTIGGTISIPHAEDTAVCGLEMEDAAALAILALYPKSVSLSLVTQKYFNVQVNTMDRRRIRRAIQPEPGYEDLADAFKNPNESLLQYPCDRSCRLVSVVLVPIILACNHYATE